MEQGVELVGPARVVGGEGSTMTSASGTRDAVVGVWSYAWTLTLGCVCVVGVGTAQAGGGGGGSAASVGVCGDDDGDNVGFGLNGLVGGKDGLLGRDMGNPPNPKGRLTENGRPVLDGTTRA
ncbi:hypothetical protein PHYSODRAFT_305365 [Phytophthora sojae]|uniref:Uncharacterized protein n=1 Tax=Phytophthora sojae (strain P6497) TaxID=1094619 RepID=G5A339_PHYSP|nr:hypothetical protein PHYSODRAFT_305365 [Phytophthora sojae]EGZ10079.1 hypothetical protein PHYSODRAFT_305365 [Phytophthora sojae]|eukprot:XP_009534940.1 hypothetical protein PHYSODRAFT_305365 [Phytophthora sojae]